MEFHSIGSEPDYQGLKYAKKALHEPVENQSRRKIIEEQQEYYGHPRNAFWPIIAAVCGRELPVSYVEKTTILLDGGIALWDVCRGCEREGSLDSNICNETPNAIDRLLATHPNIQTLFFNGQNAERLFKRYFPEIWKLSRHHTLPSTSPAYTLPFEKKRDAWSIVGLR